MRGSGAVPVLLGACLASAAVHQCSCFTAGPRVESLVSTPTRSSRPSRSVRLWSTRPGPKVRSLASASAAASPAAAGASAAAAPATTAATTAEGIPDVGRRKKTRLSYGRTEGTAGDDSVVAGSSSSGNSSGVDRATTTAVTTTIVQQQQQPIVEQTTNQLLRNEVAARRARAWGLVGLPTPPAGGYDGHGLGEDNWTQATTVGGGGGGGGAAAVEDDDTAADASLLLERKRQRQLEEAQVEHQQRLLDMTQPPPELAAAAQTRSIDDMGKALLPATESQQQQQQQQHNTAGQGDGEREEGAAGLWASRGMLAGAAMLYGTNFGCVKLLEESVPMSLAAALRFSVALVPFIPFLKKVNPGVFRAGAEVGLLNAIGYWAQSESLMTTSASKSAFICSLAVVFVPVLDSLLGAKDGPEAANEKAAAKAAGGGLFAKMNGPWFPALLAAAGVACLELIGVEGGPNSGDVWALVQPLCFGLGFWLTERCSRKYPDEIFGIVAAQLLTVAVLAVGWCVQAGDLPLSLESLRETVLPSSGNLAVPISLLWTGLVTTSLTVFGETVAMKEVSAAESTVILSTEPIWGTAFAACLLGERIGWNTGLGALLIVSACTWSSVGPSLQAKLLSLMAAAGTTAMAESSGMVDVDDLAETVGTVIQDLVE